MIISKQLLKGTGAQTYTSPANTRTKITAINASNNTAGAVTCTITMSGAVRETKTLGIGESWAWSKCINHILEATDTLVTAGSGVDFLVSGSQEQVKP